jgi:hypothetical protein
MLIAKKLAKKKVNGIRIFICSVDNVLSFRKKRGIKSKQFVRSQRRLAVAGLQ